MDIPVDCRTHALYVATANLGKLGSALRMRPNWLQGVGSLHYNGGPTSSGLWREGKVPDVTSFPQSALGTLEVLFPNMRLTENVHVSVLSEGVLELAQTGGVDNAHLKCVVVQSVHQFIPVEAVPLGSPPVKRAQLRASAPHAVRWRAVPGVVSVCSAGSSLCLTVLLRG
eukprot:3662198-Amphidinium_carterae.1